MKNKVKIISFVVLIVLVIIFGYVVYSNASKNDEKSLSEKVISEIRYLEVKLIEIANQTNNIIMQNYKVSVENIEDSSGESQSSGTGSGDSGNDSNNQDSSQKNSNSNSSDNSSKQSGSSSSESSGNESKEQYSLDMTNPLINSSTEIDWNDILNKIEEIYLAIPTITLDLYQTNINQQDILDFNSYLDNLTIEAKANNKQNTLARICDMYSCISKFVDSISDDEVYKTAIKTKNSVLRGYALIDTNNWNEVSQNIQNGIDVISGLLTNANIEDEKQININKSYVIINELKNAAQKQDKEIFFTKYKNLLEETNSL